MHCSLKNVMLIINNWVNLFCCCGHCKGTFTPDANEALRSNDLHVKSMKRRDRQSCGANCANYTALIERLGRLTRELKNLSFGGYSRRVNQSGACSSNDVISSRGRKSKTTMEDKLIVVVCGSPELYDTTYLLHTFTKTGINFATRLELPGRFFFFFFFLQCKNLSSCQLCI